MEILDKILSVNLNYYIIGLIAVFFTLEQVSRTPFSFRKRRSHLLQNILFHIILTILNVVFVSVQVYCIEWLNANHAGLLYFIELPFWTKLFISVALYDFTTYWIHRASHKIPLLWRLHRVHHSDTTMDSSTTFRFHPLELILIYQTGNILTAGLFGTDVTSMALYYFVLYIFFFFEHANLKYPKWLNNTLGLVFVMPNHHRVHHHQEQFYTDSNFSDILIIWDRIFGTFKLIPAEEVKYGLKEFEPEEKQTFLYLMKSPFITTGPNQSGNQKSGKNKTGK